MSPAGPERGDEESGGDGRRGQSEINMADDVDARTRAQVRRGRAGR